jgi:3',5'-cyclic AMP phosphodiesterase CpdA
MLFFTSCQKQDTTLESKKNDKLRIAVFSDPHYMDPSLIKKDGKALENYLNQDRKLLKESPYILDELINKLKEEHPDIVLIPGDLSKDGEYISHKKFADIYLQKLEDSGIKVFVIPGNHDINNPHASIYNGDNTTRTRTINKNEFADIYNKYGYQEAIARDPSSLSYVVELNDKLRLLAIDVCKYELNDFEKNTCITGGRIKAETMNFIQKQAKEAKKKGIELFVMQHHGIVEHFPNQGILMPEYLIDDWRTNADKFIELGIKIVFSGHFHAQDIVKYSMGKKDLYDIETGSTVTYPCPYRMITYSNNTLSIRSKKIESIKYDLANGINFQTYAKGYVEKGIFSIIKNYSQQLPEEYQDNKLINLIGRITSDAIVSHYKGDENINQEQKNNILLYNSIIKGKEIPSKYTNIVNIINNSWVDLIPQDNSTDILLK